MPPCGLTSLSPPVHAPPAPHNPLDVGGRARASYAQQSSLGLRAGHAGQRADLRVGQLPAGQSLGEQGQRPEGARDPDPFPGRA